MQRVNIGVLIFDGVEELDWTGPLEVLAAWARGADPDRFDARVFTLAPGDGVVRCAHGVRVLPDYTTADTPPIDILVVPGGGAPQLLDEHPEILGWMHDLAAEGALMTSVCTGAVLYARAGLLTGKPATTWYGAFERLVAADPTIEPRRNDRVVDVGSVITSAGVSAGIDMALYLVRRLDSDEAAEDVRQYIQYERPLADAYRPPAPVS